MKRTILTILLISSFALSAKGISWEKFQKHLKISGYLQALYTLEYADNKTEKVMFKMPDGSSVTVAYSAIDVDGNRLFKGKAWMNEDGYNEIRVYIYRNSVWKPAGTLEYTVE